MPLPAHLDQTVDQVARDIARLPRSVRLSRKYGGDQPLQNPTNPG
jgi:hypothetical protein